MDEIVCYNGDMLPSKDLKISPLNRGIMYGDGCFETFKSYSGSFLYFGAHYQRLKDAFEYLNIRLELSKDDLHNAIKALINANKLENDLAIIRFQCWRKGGRGYKTKSRDYEWFITSNPIKNQSFSALKLQSSNIPVIPSKALNRNVKLSNGLNYIVAANEADSKGYDDALMFTMDGFISETTISNIFWGKGNTIYTPSVECDLLPGITRKLLFESIEKSEFDIFEDKFKIGDILNAEYVFTTNSISEIRVVQQIDKTHFYSTHPELLRIKSLFEALKNELLSDG